MAEITNLAFRDELGKVARSAWMDGYLRLPGASEQFLAWERMPLSEREPYCQIGGAVWHCSIDRLQATIAELERHLISLSVSGRIAQLTLVPTNGRQS